MRLACYLSTHGFGHAVRSLAVLEELYRQRPGLQVSVITGVPSFLFSSLKARYPNFRLIERASDFGLIQKDPRVFSLSETADSLTELLKTHEAQVEAETEFLASEKIEALWCDLPFLPFRAAKALNLPTVGMGNFTWDWIYRYYEAESPVFGEVSSLARACYQTAGLFLKLPFCHPLTQFSRVVDIPLVTRRPGLTRAETRARLNLSETQEVVLVGFSALELGPEALKKLEGLEDRVFLLPSPLDLEFKNGLRVDGARIDFQSLVAASDLLMTKLGYGVVSDAIRASIPLVYTDRGDFPELPLLFELADTSLGTVSLAMEPFESGEWGPALDEARRLQRIKKREELRIDGAEVAASLVLEFCEA